MLTPSFASTVASTSSGSGRRTRLFLLLVMVPALCLTAGVCLHSPFSVAPMPQYFRDATQWSPTTSIPGTFTPLGYPLFLAPAYFVAGTRGILLVQALLYLALVAVSFALLRRLETSPWINALGVLPIVFDPDFFASVSKTWDVVLGAFLLVAVALLCVRVHQLGANDRVCIALGIAWGASVFCRPDTVCLAPVLLYAVWSSGSPARGRRLLLIVVVGVTAGLSYAAAGGAAHGHPFVPGNGPYNLFAGNNPLSEQILLEKLNAEPSIYGAMEMLHPGLVPAGADYTFYYDPRLQALYVQDVIRFARAHPVGELRLAGVKLFTLFRPDTKNHPLRSAAGLAKSLYALPAVVFLVALFAPGRPRLEAVDWLLFSFELTYIVPFVITNADPRFRCSLDVLLILHQARLFSLRARPA